MYLKALTIRGFKSFARKTVLEFEPGVTVIVGPNGSGKSNIADAVTWVLGEQSPTLLRGNRMEDVIFAGSASQRPVNLAEVELVLDNSGSDFALDYSEVTITRNVVRGGDSEYRLNSSSCRLLDIQEMLSDAGVGRSLNAVIGQGQLDEVLLCRPEERRDYIEEAGGLLKYRRRREKAIRRLARMDDELLRINDVTREVRRQLRPLVRQAGRLEQYQGLAKELSEARLRLDVARLRAMQQEWKQHEDVQRDRRERLEVLDRALAEARARVADLERGDEGWRHDEARLRDALYRLVSVHEQLRALLPVWEEKKKLLDMSMARRVDRRELEEADRRAAAMEKTRSELEGKLEPARQQESELVALADGLTGRHAAVTREVIALEARLQVLHAEREPDDSERLRVLEGELAALTRDQAGLEEDVRHCEKRLEAVALESAGIESWRGSQAARSDEIIKRVRRLESEQASIVTRLDMLSRLDTERWDVLNSTGALLRDDPTHGGLGGMLINSLRIDRRHEKAVLGFLGPWAYALQARDADSVIDAVRHLKERRLGQSLFFVGAGESAGQDDDDAHAPIGAVKARDVVDAASPFSEIVGLLLDRVYIAEDMKTAFDLSGAYPDLSFISPDGDVVSRGVLAKGGSVEVGPLHLEMTRTGRDELEGALVECRSGLESAELELSSCRAVEAEMSAKLEDSRRAEVETFAALRRSCELLSGLVARKEAIESELAGEPLGRHGSTGIDLPAEEARLAELKAQESELSARSGPARSSASTAADQRKAIESEIALLDRDIEAVKGRQAQLRLWLEGEGPVAPASDEDHDLASLESLRGLHAGLLETVRSQREAVRARIEEGAQRQVGVSAGARALRDEIAASQRQHEELLEQMHSEDLSRAELKIRVEQLVDRIVDEHKVPLEFALAQHLDESPTPELEQSVEELSARMENIGPVNPEAIAERQALEERYDFLRTQLDDIDKSRAQLKRVVREIDREIIDKFKFTVEEVNRHFKEIFSFLFPNGSAEVRLTDPDDPLASGVEVFAQPEGKRLRRMSLLSGGETSLTAIAFFFALFRVRPSPFYFLDEVEAALDDVNLHRFLELVKQFKEESQLVLITHQKRSMEIADVLYGVSMQEDGVSRVVSQRAAEAVVEEVAG